jgi:hypothetical protein
MSEGPGIENAFLDGSGMTGNTRTGNPEYNLVSVLYHALQGADLYQQYASDAGSDQDLANFFREVQQQEQQRAERAKKLLAIRLQRSSDMSGIADEVNW